MPMNEEVRKAVELLYDLAQAGEWLSSEDVDAAMLVRAELTRLYAIADSVDPLVVRLGEVTTKLDAANALVEEWRLLARIQGSKLSRGAYTHCADMLEASTQAHLSEPRT